jgi:Rod binding domain-containing protein
MTRPIAPGGQPSFSPSPMNSRMQWGDNALTAPTTPGKRMPVVDKTKVDPATLNAAQGMEAMFLDYMMKVMRQSVPKNETDLESPATEVYRSMMDTETAQRAARAGGVGLADQIVAYLEAERYTQEAGVSTPGAAQRMSRVAKTRITGGTHEGQSNRK